jgi:hypothetical protein
MQQNKKIELAYTSVMHLMFFICKFSIFTQIIKCSKTDIKRSKICVSILYNYLFIINY